MDGTAGLNSGLCCSRGCNLGRPITDWRHRENIRVITDHGPLLVGVQGKLGRQAIFTYHDIGLNSEWCFDPLFNFYELKDIMQHFTVYHITAPGQEDYCVTLPEEYRYPTMDELAGQIDNVREFFRVRSFIGFGVGAGANILARYALNKPSNVDALILVDCSSTTAGWIEWLTQKANWLSLRNGTFHDLAREYMMFYLLGRNARHRHNGFKDIIQHVWRDFINMRNLGRFIHSYVNRTDLKMSRNGRTLQVPVLNITGAYSSSLGDTIVLNEKLDPARSSWIKLSDCANPIQEQAVKFSEIFLLFLQGEGLAPPTFRMNQRFYIRHK